MSHSNPLVSVLCQNLRTPGRRAFLLRGTILLAMAAAWLSAAPAARAQCPLSFAAAVNYGANYQDIRDYFARGLAIISEPGADIKLFVSRTYDYPL